MIDHRNRKKKLIISYKNLPEDIRELFKETYPEGYKDFLQKTIKPNGEPIFVVPLETDDTSYMIKFDVVIDTGLVEEDLDKDLYGDDSENESDFAPISEAIDKEEGNNHAVGKMRHGALEEILDGIPDSKAEFEIASADIAAELGDQSDDEPDAYLDNDDHEVDDDDIEPDDDELLDIEALLEEADSGEGILREENPPEEKRGRKKKNESNEVKAVKAVREEVQEARKTSKKETKAKSETKTKSEPKAKAEPKPKTTAAKPAKTVKTKAEATPAKPAKTTAKATTKSAAKPAEKKTTKKK